MLKIKKTTGAMWSGNGMGSEKADWVVVGQENIAIRNYAGRWNALDLSEYTVQGHRKIFKRIVSADTRKDLLTMLESKIS